MNTENLFDSNRQEFLSSNQPLAARMRPRTLDQFIGQDHIIGPGRLLRRAITADQLSSLIFYGPPGTGKTTLARIIANTTKAHFITLNAVLAGVKDIRASINEANDLLGMHRRRTILFIDEVHRFNKAQQDALLPHVENGTVIFIGATTENPYFEVNKALVSRSRIFELTSLEDKDIEDIAKQAIDDSTWGYGKKKVSFVEDSLKHLVQVSNGDARAVLNALELAVETTKADSETGEIVISRGVAEESIQKKAVLYDKDGDIHYDIISAFIKSVRGSDPDAALYWMARMVKGGEDPKFIFRRMIILASEDIGMADPNALTVVTSAATAFDYVGMPEGRFHLSQACLYLATAPKSNSSLAFFDALASVEEEKNTEPLNHLKDANRDGDAFGHGKGYLYPHAYKDHWVAQQYLPDVLQGKVFYQPTKVGYEKQIKENVERNREEQLAVILEKDTINETSPSWQAMHTKSKNSVNEWLIRTSNSAGKGLGFLRNKLFAISSIKRESMVLVLNENSGLLLWEALRLASAGTVWAQVENIKQEELLNKMSINLMELNRPSIFCKNLELLNEIFEDSKNKEVKFDSIIARDILKNNKKDNFLSVISERLMPNGIFVFSERSSSLTMRLYSLFSKEDFSEDIYKGLKQSEDDIYGSSTLEDEKKRVKEILAKNNLDLISMEIDSDSNNILQIDRKTIREWFLPSDDESKPSYSWHLSKHLSIEQINEVESVFYDNLANKKVKWRDGRYYCRVGVLTK